MLYGEFLLLLSTADLQPVELIKKYLLISSVRSVTNWWLWCDVMWRHDKRQPFNQASNVTSQDILCACAIERLPQRTKLRNTSLPSTCSSLRSVEVQQVFSWVSFTPVATRGSCWLMRNIQIWWQGHWNKDFLKNDTKPTKEQKK